MTSLEVSIEAAGRENLSTVTSAGLFGRDDVAVVGVGPAACLRVLYFRACRAGRLYRLKLCPLSRVDYALGDYEKVETSLRQAAAMPGIRAVILYVSCADLLAGADYEETVSRMGPLPVPVFVFRRGPLQKRKVKPAERLAEILSEIDGLPPTALEAVQAEAAPLLPPLASDYSGVCRALRDAPLFTLLCTPGGCSSCVTAADGFEDPRFWLTKWNDLQAAEGCGDGMAQSAAQRCAVERKRAAFFVGTPVPAITGVDFSRMESQARARGLEAFSVESDGFSSAPVGYAKLCLAALSRFRPAAKSAEKRVVNVLGLPERLLERSSDFCQAQSWLRELGAELSFFHPDEEGRWSDGGAAVNWVLEAEGLEAAQELEKRTGTPFLAGLPIGSKGSKAWRESLSRLLRRPLVISVGGSERGPAELEGKSVLIIAPPLQARALGRCVREDSGAAEVTLASYAPDLETRRLYAQDAFSGEALSFFSGAEELNGLALKALILLGDGLYGGALPPEKARALIPVPDLDVSGGVSPQKEVPLFGDAFLEYLREQLCKRGLLS